MEGESETQNKRAINNIIIVAAVYIYTHNSIMFVSNISLHLREDLDIYMVFQSPSPPTVPPIFIRDPLHLAL